MATTLYLRLSQAAPAGVVLPSGYLGNWVGPGPSTTGGANAKALLAASGTSQQRVSFAANGAITQSIAQFLSAPLGAQTIAAGNWVVGTAWEDPDLGGGYQAAVFLGILKGDGSGLRGTVSNRVLGSWFLGSTETASFLTISGSAVTVEAGDALLLEGGFANNQATTNTIDLFTDGTTAITADNTTTSSAQSFVTAPQTLIFASPFVPVLWPRRSAIYRM